MPRNRLTLLVPVVVLVLACTGGAAAKATAAAAAADSVSKDSAAKKPAAKPAASRRRCAPHHRHRGDGGHAAAGARDLSYEGSHRDPFQPIVERWSAVPNSRTCGWWRYCMMTAIPPAASRPSATSATISRYTLAPGQRIGRISVVSVGRNNVKLREDDFGTARDQTYAMRKPEDRTP